MASNATFGSRINYNSNGPISDLTYKNQQAMYRGTNHMGKKLEFEPQRLYNFELQIVGLDSLFTANNQGTSEGKATNKDIKFTNASERILVACSSFSVPNTEFGMIEIPHYNNTTKYAGKVTFGDASLKIEQYLGSYTEQIITTWCKCVYDPKTQNIGYKADYAKDIYVIQYDSKGGTPRVWKMEHAWPNVLPGADWDYSSTDRRQLNLTIKCDRCIPDYGIDTNTISTYTSEQKNSVLTQTNVQGDNSNYTWTWNVNNQSYENSSSSSSISSNSELTEL